MVAKTGFQVLMLSTMLLFCVGCDCMVVCCVANTVFKSLCGCLVPTSELYFSGSTAKLRNRVNQGRHRYHLRLLVPIEEMRACRLQWHQRGRTLCAACSWWPAVASVVALVTAHKVDLWHHPLEIVDVLTCDRHVDFAMRNDVGQTAVLDLVHGVPTMPSRTDSSRGSSTAIGPGRLALPAAKTKRIETRFIR